MVASRPYQNIRSVGDRFTFLDLDGSGGKCHALQHLLAITPVTVLEASDIIAPEAKLVVILPRRPITVQVQK